MHVHRLYTDEQAVPSTDAGPLIIESGMGKLVFIHLSSAKVGLHR